MIARTSKTKTRSNDDALAAFVQRKAEIDTMLSPPAKRSATSTSASPRRGHLGPCRQPGHHAELLKRVTDSAFSEGEHAA